MGTRSNLVITDISDSFRKDYKYLYKHWDGYPDNIVPILRVLVEDIDIKKSTIGKISDFLKNPENYIKSDRIHKEAEYRYDPYVLEDWKYEDTDGIHGDVEFIYHIDIPTGTVRVIETEYDDDYSVICPSFSVGILHSTLVGDSLKNEWREINFKNRKGAWQRVNYVV